jgi:outer membrane lipoprotein SlyB
LGGLTELGFKGLGAQDPLLEQGYAGQLKGAMSENETNQRNAEMEAATRNRGIGNLIGLGTGLLGNFMGGGMGGGLGSMIGKGIGSLFGGSGGGTSQGGYSPSNYNSGSWSY